MRAKLSLLLVVMLLSLINGCIKDDNTPGSDVILEGLYISAIEVDNANLWVGTGGNGLFMFDGETWTGFTKEDGLICDTITALAISSNGTLWVGTSKGLSEYKDQEWTGYTETEGLYNNDIRSLECDQANNIWIGTRNNRLVKFNGETFTTYHVNPEASGPGELGHIHTVTFDQDGDAWVGSCISGLSVYDGETWSDNVNNLTVFVMNSLAVPGGDIWIGTYSGLYRLSGDNWTAFNSTGGLLSNVITCLVSDNQDYIWIGTDSGLSMYDGYEWISFTTSNDLISNNVTALGCDINGDIWVGSSAGLIKINSN